MVTSLSCQVILSLIFLGATDTRRAHAGSRLSTPLAAAAAVASAEEGCLTAAHAEAAGPVSVAADAANAGADAATVLEPAVLSLSPRV